MRSTGIVNGSNAQTLLNPDIGVYAYATVPVFVNADVMFRDSFQNTLLPLDICGLPNTSGC